MSLFDYIHNKWGDSPNKKTFDVGINVINTYICTHCHATIEERLQMIKILIK